MDKLGIDIDKLVNWLLEFQRQDTTYQRIRSIYHKKHEVDEEQHKDLAEVSMKIFNGLVGLINSEQNNNIINHINHELAEDRAIEDAISRLDWALSLHVGLLLQQFDNEMSKAFLEKALENKDAIDEYNYLKVLQANADSTKHYIEAVWGDRLSQITDRRYQYALSPTRNDSIWAKILPIDKNVYGQLEMNDDGTMVKKENPSELIQESDLTLKPSVKDIDTPLMMGIYTSIENSGSTDGPFEFSLANFAAHAGVRLKGDDPRGKAYDLMGKIDAYNKTIGTFGDGSFYKALIFEGYDAKRKTVRISSPYLRELQKRLKKENAIISKKSGTPIYTKPYHSYLMHTDIIGERNKPAVEITAAIIALLMQRGENKEKEEKVTLTKIEAAAHRGTEAALKKEFSDNDAEPSLQTNAKPIQTVAHKSYRGIINGIPVLCESLNTGKAATSKNQRNVLLKRAFEPVYELLKNKTDVFQYFINLSISPTAKKPKKATKTVIRDGEKKKVTVTTNTIITVLLAPSADTLDSVITISHEGKNPNYKNHI